MKTGKGMWKNYGKGADSMADDEKMIPTSNEPSGLICRKRRGGIL